MNALILAAGYATRLYPDTLHTPKALLTVGRLTMLDRTIAQIDTLPEVERIYLVTNHRFAAQFEDWRRAARRDDVTIVDDGTESEAHRLGALGDIAYVLDRYGDGGDWFIAASDNLLHFPLRELYDAYVRFGRRATICATRVADVEQIKTFAVAVLDASGRVIDLEEKPEAPKSDLGVFALYFYPHASLARLGDYFASGGSKDSPGRYPAWLYQQEPVYCHIASGPIYDVGTHAELARLRALYVGLECELHAAGDRAESPSFGDPMALGRSRSADGDPR